MPKHWPPCRPKSGSNAGSSTAQRSAPTESAAVSEPLRLQDRHRQSSPPILPNGRLRWPFRQSGTNLWRHIDLEPFEFLRRFLQHVLPAGFHRVRRFGWLHPAGRARLKRVRALLQLPPLLSAAEQAAWQPPPQSQRPLRPQHPSRNLPARTTTVPSMWLHAGSARTVATRPRLARKHCGLPDRPETCSGCPHARLRLRFTLHALLLSPGVGSLLSTHGARLRSQDRSVASAPSCCATSKPGARTARAKNFPHNPRPRANEPSARLRSTGECKEHEGGSHHLRSHS